MHSETGGPAFPIVTDYGKRMENAEGISARDYFASRAPAEIPDWFQIEPLSAAPHLPSDEHLTNGQRFECEDLRNGIKEEEDVTIEALTYHREYVAAEAELHQWQMEHDAARYFAWRWHYADMMLEGRK